MTMGLSEESDAEAADATRTWYQGTVFKTVTGGVILAGLTSIGGFMWSEYRTTTSGAHDGAQAISLAVKNDREIKDVEEKVRDVEGQVEDVDKELDAVQSQIIEKLDAIQSGVNRNRSQFERSVDALREDIRQIENHHFERPTQPSSGAVP